MDEQTASVYGLKDRRNGEVFYIGVSTDPYARYGEHLTVRSAKNAKSSRIIDMRKEGLMPELVILEQGIPMERASMHERRWIDYHLSMGAPLTNIALPYKRENPAVQSTGWINIKQVAEILSDRRKRTVSLTYAKQLAESCKITSYAPDRRTKLYWRADVEECNIKLQGDGSVRRATRGGKSV